MKYILVVCLLLPVPKEVWAGETTFVIGSRPWNFANRSRENHLTMQMRGPDSFGGAPSPPNLTASGHHGYPVSSTSYAIGNWVQVDMHLGDGSEGLIMIENHQNNQGNQQSVSDALGEIIDSYQTDASTNSKTIVE
ncbi:hypothetical protein [Sulfitobacter sp. R18_1]|uniref:hypothetical protein n=1 Tax=Sulfitobacter sp. R18_1 TaxID=2821104 RepID=UPI001ADA9CEA|nr:hypothetical protein [Sulfitobacter sp. R18_1]MBO9432322.1 hypothetical protein [Sulfitobacter sp. R18_1]